MNAVAVAVVVVDISGKIHPKLSACVVVTRGESTGRAGAAAAHHHHRAERESAHTPGPTLHHTRMKEGRATRIKTPGYHGFAVGEAGCV